MIKILVTGFDPFGSDQVNAAMELVQNLPDEIDGKKIIKCIVPTVGEQAMAIIQSIIEIDDIDYVISIGQAAGRKDITIERVAINVDDYRIPDNAGNQFVDTPIVSDGPDAYLCPMPIKQMMAAMQAKHVPAAISDSAGTFVCNHVAYATAHLLHERNTNQQSCFIHVPLLPKQAVDNQPSLSLETMIKGIEAAITILK